MVFAYFNHCKFLFPFLDGCLSGFRFSHDFQWILVANLCCMHSIFGGQSCGDSLMFRLWLVRILSMSGLVGSSLVGWKNVYNWSAKYVYDT